MPLAPYSEIPGRPGMTFWLPSDIDVDTRVVNHSRVRSYSKFTAQTKSTVHDTGNPNTSAEGEYTWLKGGRAGGSAGGYTSITDADQIILTGQYDERSWHAGTPTGNQSFGTEMAYGAGQSWEKVWKVNAAFHGALLAAFGFTVETGLVLHQYWYGKTCSRQILNRAMWPQFKAEVNAARVSAIAAATGDKVPDPNTYAPIIPIPAIDSAMKAAANPEHPALTVAPRQVFDPSSNVTFFWVGDRVEAIQDTRRRQFATEGAPDVGGIITAGTAFDVNFLFVAGDGRTYYLTPFNTRVKADHTKRISDSKVDNLTAA